MLRALDDYAAKPIFDQVAQAHVRRRLTASPVGTLPQQVSTGEARKTETHKVRRGKLSDILRCLGGNLRQLRRGGPIDELRGCA